MITDRWLHMDLWQLGPAWDYSVFAFHTLIYSGAFGIALWLASTVAKWLKHRISN